MGAEARPLRDMQHEADSGKEGRVKRPRLELEEADTVKSSRSGDERAAKLAQVRAALASGDGKRAAELCSEVINAAMSPTSKHLVPFYLARSQARLKLSETQPALVDAKSAIRADDSDPKTYLQAALCFREVGLPQNCRAALQMARTKIDTMIASNRSSTAAANIVRLRDIESALPPVGIGRLPVEVLIRIFVACDGDTLALVKMARVCRKWSKILRNAPAPWTAINLWQPEESFRERAIAVSELPHTTTTSSISILRIKRALTHAMQRTSGQVHSVQLDLTGRRGQSHLADVARMIKQTAHTLRTLKLLLPRGTQEHWLEPTAFPHLRTLYIEGGWLGIEHPFRLGAVPSLTDLIASVPVHAPLLPNGMRTVILERGHHVSASVPLLDELRGYADTIVDFRATIVRLEQEEGHSITVPDGRIRLPKLKCFEASCLVPPSPHPVTKRIHAPDLRCLVVQDIRHDQLSSYCYGFCDLPKLEELSISFCVSVTTVESRRDALRFFAQATNLCKLDISAWGNEQFVDDLIELLAPAAWATERAKSAIAEETFLPALTSLVIRRHNTMTGSVLMRSVAARSGYAGHASTATTSASTPEASPAAGATGAFKSAFKRSSSSSLTPATPSPAAPTPPMQTSSTSALSQAITASTPPVQPIQTLVLDRCPSLDARAEDWLRARVTNFARVEMNMMSVKQLEASARRIRPW